VSDDKPRLPFVHGQRPSPPLKLPRPWILVLERDPGLRVSGAIEAGRRPGMPLSILTNIAREAPLGSLLIAFLLGIAVARRR